MSEPETESGRERAMIEMAPADAAMVESFRDAAYAIDHQRDDDPNWRPPNQIIGEAFEQRGLIVARREEVVALREAAALAGPGADRLREALRLVTRDCPACRDRETGCSDPVHLAARTALGEES